MIVALLSLPQVFIQVVTLALQPQSLTIQYNEDESKGRVMCDTGLDMKSSLSSYGVWTFLLLVLVLLFMAHTTSRLPSLFNETLVIYESALFSIVLLMLGLGVVFITDDPTTSPTVGYLVQVFSALSIAANTSLRIMMPKLRMVWRDEKVVVSKLVSDHAKHIREEDERFNIKTQTPGIVSGLTPPERKPSATTITTHSTAHSNSPEVADEMVSNFDGGYDHLHTSVLDVDHGDLVDTPNNEDMDLLPDSSAELALVPPGSSGKPATGPEGSFRIKLSYLPSRTTLSNTIMVQCDETPARRPVLKMVDLQEQLVAVNGRIMSGLAVSEDEWIAVRELTSKPGATFNYDVNFAWEEQTEALISAKDLSSKDLNKHATVEETEKDDSEHH
jgi:hypothetical protein